MRTSPRFVVVVVAVVVAGFLPAPAGAQQADAVLVPVESGRLDALSAAEVIEEREMCLRDGMYVLAFSRGPHGHPGFALVEHDGTRVASVALRASDQEGMGWGAFSVEGSTCPNLVTFHGRARVYELRVTVDW